MEVDKFFFEHLKKKPRNSQYFLPESALRIIKMHTNKKKKVPLNILTWEHIPAHTYTHTHVRELAVMLYLIM